MKVISDKEITAHLNSVSREDILEQYIPILLDGLHNYEENPDGLPERTVRPSVTPNSDCTHLFMPCILAHNVGVKVISGGPTNSKRNLGFQGSISVMDEHSGELVAVLNAKSITAFRTALASCVGLVRVFPPEKDQCARELTVFGAGPQSYWHVVLASKLYPLSKVTLVSRNVQSANALKDQLAIGVPVQALGVEDPRVRECVLTSTIIFGCTPSTDGIIRDDYISHDGRLKYVSLIGSYKPHMYEMALSFMAGQYAGGTKILVDSATHCLAEAGELIQTGIQREQVVELSDLESFDMAQATTESGVVLSKIVGLSVMDIAVAKHLGQAIEGTEVDF